MNKLETMRRIICGLCIWNLVLTAGFGIFLHSHFERQLNSKICNLEAIPPFEIIEEF